MDEKESKKKARDALNTAFRLFKKNPNVLNWGLLKLAMCVYQDVIVNDESFDYCIAERRWSSGIAYNTTE